ncbi:hypothetical protein H0H87_007546 [Tephrocybe sp. NHM501043]|nr:hypothetical protein H0H87_007546 [Tephrocybe sp. NHM501043]
MRDGVRDMVAIMETPESPPDTWRHGDGSTRNSTPEPGNYTVDEFNPASWLQEIEKSKMVLTVEERGKLKEKEDLAEVARQDLSSSHPGLGTTMYLWKPGKTDGMYTREPVVEAAWETQWRQRNPEDRIYVSVYDEWHLSVPSKSSGLVPIGVDDSTFTSVAQTIEQYMETAARNDGDDTSLPEAAWTAAPRGPGDNVEWGSLDPPAGSHLDRGDGGNGGGLKIGVSPDSEGSSDYGESDDSEEREKKERNKRLGKILRAARKKLRRQSGDKDKGLSEPVSKKARTESDVRGLPLSSSTASAFPSSSSSRHHLGQSGWATHSRSNTSSQWDATSSHTARTSSSHYPTPSSSRGLAGSAPSPNAPRSIKVRAPSAYTMNVDMPPSTGPSWSSINQAVRYKPSFVDIDRAARSKFGIVIPETDIQFYTRDDEAEEGEVAEGLSQKTKNGFLGRLGVAQHRQRRKRH